MAEVPTTRSFSRLATIPLGASHILHPGACNPTMDLVALLHEDDGTAPGALGKGKSRAGDLCTTVTLWRITGSKVWETEVSGRVLGLAWSLDGLFLSLVVLRLNTWLSFLTPAYTSRSTIEHLSVHTGKVAKAIPVPPSLMGVPNEADWGRRAHRPEWWHMEWVDGGSKWDKPKPGSALMLLDVLPRVTPVDPPKPAVINPFAPPPPTAKDLGLHKKLSSFPALLPSPVPVPPDVLIVGQPPRRAAGSYARFLTGTFPLVQGTPTHPPASTLALAERAHAIVDLIDVVLRGLEACQAAFKEGEKQTMIWRDELESCGAQHGMSAADVHADLFRFLMVGRCGPAVGEWIGNRMTNRTVSKWEQSLVTGFHTVHKVLAQSISPALERIILILVELEGWTSELVESDLVIDRETLQRAIDIARGFTILCDHVRQDAEVDQVAVEEWTKWLRYELARTTASADDAVPEPTYDLKFVWSFMRQGFVSSRIKRHFPNVPDAADDVLPKGIPTKPAANRKPLDAVMRTTLTRLTSPRMPADLGTSPLLLPDHSFSPSRGASTTQASPLMPSPIASSPDTMGSPDTRPEEPIQRHPTLELWAWANTLLAACSETVRSAQYPNIDGPSTPTRSPLLNTLGRDEAVDERVLSGTTWAAYSPKGELAVVRVSDSEGAQAARLVLPGAEVVQAQFFDDDELAIVFNSAGQRYLGTVSVEGVLDAMSPVNVPGELDVAIAHLPETQLTLARCRLIGTVRAEQPRWILALNGRQGRRSGCVLTRSGAEAEVLDLATNEDSEEEEDEEEDVTMGE